MLETFVHTVKLISPFGRGNSLVFEHNRSYIILTVTLSAGGIKRTDDRKNLRFQVKSSFFLGRSVRLANGYYGSLTRSHRYPIDLMTLNDRERLPGFPG